MQRSFELTRTILEEIDRQAASGDTAITCRSGSARAAEKTKFEVLTALFEHGFVDATIAEASGEREMQSLALTSDGQDLLDALRSDKQWAWIEGRSQERGEPLTLGCVKAII